MHRFSLKQIEYDLARICEYTLSVVAGEEECLKLCYERVSNYYLSVNAVFWYPLGSYWRRVDLAMNLYPLPRKDLKSGGALCSFSSLCLNRLI